MRNLTVDDILISRKQPSLRQDRPFTYLVFEEFLPRDIYESLYETFPGDDFFELQIYNGKQSFAMTEKERMDRFLALTPSWRAAIEAFNSDAFMADIERYFRKEMIGLRLFAGMQRWRRYPAHEATPVLERPVELQWEFSRLGRDAWIDPHTDKLAKLVSFLLYFPDPQWRPEFGGSTDLYKAKHARHNQNWSNKHLPFNAVERVCSCDFAPNRMLIFIKSANSYHGVSPLAQPAGMWRKSLNLNMVVPHDIRSSLYVRGVESVHRRMEYWRFREYAALSKETPVTHLKRP